MTSFVVASALLTVGAVLALFRLIRKVRRRRIRERVVADVRTAIEPWLKPELATTTPPETEPQPDPVARHRLVLGSPDEPSSPRHKWVS